MIFKVGQKVRVVNELAQGHYEIDSSLFLENLSFYKDKVMTVKEFKLVNGTNKMVYKLEGDPNNFNWSPKFLEPVTEEQNPEDLGVHAISKDGMAEAVKKSWDIMEKGYEEPEEIIVINTSEEEISAGQPVKAIGRLSGTEVGISIPITPTTSTITPIAKHRKALVLFSGGFDSVALAVKVIESGKYAEVTLLYEQVTVFDDHKQLAYNIFTELVKRYKDKKVIILFDTIDLDLDWATNPGQDHLYGERDLCLMVHLTTIFGKGQYGSIYLGWNRANIVDLPYSNNLLAFLEKFRNNSSVIYFLENEFLDEHEYHLDMTWKASITKRRVVKLLLEHKLFSLCSAQGHPTPDKHWYDTSPKWQEVVNAIIDLDFTAQELGTVFKYKTLDTVQKVWDKKTTPKHVRITNKARVVEKGSDEQVVVEE